MNPKVLCGLVAALAATWLGASTITFPSSNNTFTENGDSFTVDTDGYVWNTNYHSAPYAAVCSVSNGTITVALNGGRTFQANSLWLQGDWDGYRVQVKGLHGGSQLYSTGTITLTAAYSQTTLSGWTGIDTIAVTGVDNGFVAVDDIDYTVANTAPTDITLSNNRVTDGSASGTLVGTLSTTDAFDAGPHTYTFASGGTDNASFTISGDELHTAFVADAATKSSYNVKIRTTDSGGLYYEESFTIIVTPPATVWTGPTVTFTKANFADWTQEPNQDRLTSLVWITRKDSEGLFNAATETGFNYSDSPTDTEWATGTTADYATLSYQAWVDWNGWSPPSMVGVNAVLHLISENIYIDITFTSWTSGAAGGGFTYERSTSPVPVELQSFTIEP